MSHLFVIRHGQANFNGDNYDQLSEKGWEQSRLLGERMANQELLWDHVVCGPKRRHRETMEAVSRAYEAAGRPFPEPVFVPGFDEHRGASVVVQYLEQRGQMPDKDTPDGFRQYFSMFEDISRRWVQGEIHAPDLESWSQFRDRVIGGLEDIINNRAGKVAVFTSGGPVGLISAHSLGASDVKAMELSWKIRNTGYAEFLFKADRFSMVRCNATPHISDSHLETMI